MSKRIGAKESTLCRKCNAPFGEDNRRASHTALCLPCNRIRQKEWRARAASLGKSVRGAPPLGWKKEWAKRYNKLPYVKEARRQEAADRRSDPNYQVKIRAQLMVSRAIQRGRLTRQACEICGEAKTDAHHDDYTQPLAVRWLCRLHHRRLHLELREVGDGENAGGR